MKNYLVRHPISHLFSRQKFFFLSVILILLFSGCSADRTPTKIKIGDAAPDFQVTDLEGNIFDLSAHRGSPVVLRFWSTDCKYCRADTPIFNYYFNKYKEKGLIVLYINRGSDEKTVKDFVDDLEIEFPVVLDKDSSISKSYNIRLEPQTIIISPDHHILAAILGGVSEQEFEELLGGYF